MHKHNLFRLYGVGFGGRARYNDTRTHKLAHNHTHTHTETQTHAETDMPPSSENKAPATGVYHPGAQSVQLSFVMFWRNCPALPEVMLRARTTRC